MLQREPRTPPEYIYPVDKWRVVEKRYAPEFLEQAETIFALANGYLGIRGAFEEGRPAFQSGTFVNGFHETWPIPYGEAAYGFAKTGQTMLNVADAKLMKLFVDDEPFVAGFAHLASFERVLDMRAGTLEREVVWLTPAGKTVTIRSTRLVSLVHRHLAAIRYEVVLGESDAPLDVISEILVPAHTSKQEGDPRRTRGFEERVLLPQLQTTRERRRLLGHRTRNSAMSIVCGVDHVVETDCDWTVRGDESEDRSRLVFSVRGCAGKSFAVTKYMTYHTSHTSPVAELADRAERTLDRALADGWFALLVSQREFVSDFWRRSDVRIRGDRRVQQSVRWNLFQLMQASARTEGAGIGARGLTGQTYEGHYFWDTEIYVLPFLVYTAPHVARNLLRFRYGMLDQARERATLVGQRGALFPWRTITGEEASTYYAAGTAQYHIDADIMYAVRKYVEVTGDIDFLCDAGAEMLVETARLWRSLGFYSRRRGGKFCIHAVTGPDEYNTVVNNNTFTNLMARENLRYASDTLQWLRAERPEAYTAVVDRTGLDESEIDDWRRAAAAMLIPYDEELGIHPQDDSFLDKQPWDFAGMPADRHPLLLYYHPLVIYRYAVIKQADVVMAMFLLPNEFDTETKRRDFDFYDPLTTGDSSLSVCIQSIVASEIGYQEEAYEYFRYAVLVDLADIGGNVRDGAHIAAIGGTWMALVYGFAGLRDFGGLVSFAPRLPAEWQSMSFPLRIRDSEIRVDIGHDEATYELLRGPELELRHLAFDVVLRAGEPVTLATRRAVSAAEITIDDLVSRERYDAVLFDMDGVLTQTADLHATAWKRMFDAYLQERAARTGVPFRPFEVGTEYLRHVDGKPRLAGVHDFLASRDIQLPVGNPDDPPDAETEWGLGNRKNELIGEVLRTQGVRVYPGTVRVLGHVRGAGLKTAVVTSSANAVATLAAAGLANHFDARIDGNVAAEAHLAGKPAPDTYLAAARELGVPPARAVVVEDAISGVMAGRAGDFGLVIGVARGPNEEELRRNGADVVVHDLSELLPGARAAGGQA